MLLLLVGCRQIFGIHDPQREVADATETDAAFDANAIDAGFAGPDAALDCTMLPALPPNVVTEHENGTATTLAIKDFGLGSSNYKYFVGAAGATVTAHFTYTFTDSSCATSCIDQIEIGYIPGDRVACPFDGAITSTGTSGSATQMLTLPTTLGWTSVRLAIGQNFSCTFHGAHTWYEGVPPAEDTVGYVCVQ